MKRAVLHLEFATPAFLGGATPGALAEWRSASIRGQWRWWFRALAGPALADSPQRVAAAESHIFGSTGTQSLLQIRAEHDNLQVFPVGARLPDLQRRDAAALASAWAVPPSHAERSATVSRLEVLRNNQEVATNTAAYLAYGCIDFKSQLTRSCIAPDARVRIVLQWSPSRWSSVSADLQRLTGRSLAAWLLLGGIGSKCRKGFGSLHLTRVEGDLPDGFEPPAAPTSTHEHRAALDALLTTALPSANRSWSQLTTSSRLHVGPSTRTWQDALDRVGGWLIAFRRRYGIAAEIRTGLANRDYEWHKGQGNGIPDRAGFGLPLPFGEHGPIADAKPPRGEKKTLRRASPLLVHVERLGAASYVPVFIHLGGPFLPGGAEVYFAGGSVRERSTTPTPDQLDVVDRFLDDLVAKKLVSQPLRPTP